MLLFFPIFTHAYDENNCWSYGTERIGKVVSMATIRSNLHQDPQRGDLTYMWYEKAGLPHVAYVEAVLDDKILISETNYHFGEFSYRFIPKDYPNLRGYYTP